MIDSEVQLLLDVLHSGRSIEGSQVIPKKTRGGMVAMGHRLLQPGKF